MLVALTRESGRNEELAHWVRDLADVVEVPLTTTRFRQRDEVREELRQSPHFATYRSLVVTSSRSQAYLDLAREALSRDAGVYSVGPATTRAVQHAGFSVAVESVSGAAPLASSIEAGPVLILTAVAGRDELATLLRARGRDVTVIETYETVDVVLDVTSRERLGDADVVFIGAPSAWRAAREFVRRDAWVLVPGATTREAVRADHERVILGWGEDFTSAWDVVTSSSR